MSERGFVSHPTTVIKAIEVKRNARESQWPIVLSFAGVNVFLSLEECNELRVKLGEVLSAVVA